MRNIGGEEIEEIIFLLLRFIDTLEVNCKRLKH